MNLKEIREHIEGFNCISSVGDFIKNHIDSDYNFGNSTYWEDYKIIFKFILDQLDTDDKKQDDRYILKNLCIHNIKIGDQVVTSYGTRGIVTAIGLSYLDQPIFVLESGDTVFAYDVTRVVEAIPCRQCEFFMPDVECKFFNNAFVDEDGGCTYGILKKDKEDADGE